MFSTYSKSSRYNYIRQRPQPITKDSRQNKNITAGGHIIKKSIEDGDDKLLLEPQRYFNDGVFLYKRYNFYQYSNTAILSYCKCHGNGYLCEYCQVLNTSCFHDLEIPLNQKDWSVMKNTFLVKYKWSDKNLYNWLKFWIKVEERRWSHNCLIFFQYDKFYYKYKHTYRFFYYLFQFVSNGNVDKPDVDKYKPRPVDMNGGLIRGQIRGQSTQKNCMALITCDALIRLSFHIYNKGGHITRCTTKRWKHKYSKIHYTYEDDPRNDSFCIHQKVGLMMEKMRWKRLFQYTIDQINNEVRFRPGMCGMDECMLSFATYMSKLN